MLAGPKTQITPIRQTYTGAAGAAEPQKKIRSCNIAESIMASTLSDIDRILKHVKVEKRCFCCGLILPATEFTKRSYSPDGLQCRCRRCLGKYKREHYRKNRDKMREGCRRWKHDHLDKRREYFRAFRKHRAQEARAGQSVRDAVRSGRLDRGPCAICGDTFCVHAHHTDYQDRLNVIWLCPKHHSELHRRMKEGADAVEAAAGEENARG